MQFGRRKVPKYNYRKFIRNTSNANSVLLLQLIIVRSQAPMIFFFSTKDHTKYPTLTTFWHLKITDVFSQCGKTPRKLLNVSLRKSTKTGRYSQTNFILDHMIIAWSSYDVRWGSLGFLHNVGTRASVMFFLKTFIFLLFKVTKSHQKAMSKVRTIVCCSKYPA